MVTERKCSDVHFCSLINVFPIFFYLLLLRFFFLFSAQCRGVRGEYTELKRVIINLMSILTPEINQGDQLAEKAGKVFEKLPLPYKRFALMPDFLLLLGGIKSATDFSFLGNTWNEQEFQVFKDVFESESLVLSEIDTRPTKSGDTFRMGLIFNPVQLEKETASSKYAPPYKLGTDVHQYAEDAIKSGYEEGAVWGKIYSFPESAIGNYVQGDKTGLSERAVTHQGGETYWFFEPAGEDILARETAKARLFSSLEQSPKYNELVASDSLRESNEEWTNRLPDWTPARNLK